jgi:transcriptional regulator of arginine metabolism
LVTLFLQLAHHFLLTQPGSGLHIYTCSLIIIHMTKRARQQLIVDLAHSGPLPSQQKLVKVLARQGFPVTQATLSRDLTELRLVKTSEGYILRNGDMPAEPLPGLSRVVHEFVRAVRRAQNLLVVKTIPGSAQPVAVAIDAEVWASVVGTIAGDDTVLVIAVSGRAAKQIQSRLEEMRA